MVYVYYAWTIDAGGADVEVHVTAPPKRKRGRPRKQIVIEEENVEDVQTESSVLGSFVPNDDDDDDELDHRAGQASKGQEKGLSDS